LFVGAGKDFLKQKNKEKVDTTEKKNGNNNKKQKRWKQKMEIKDGSKRKYQFF
jgi:hypothetical protein